MTMKNILRALVLLLCVTQAYATTLNWSSESRNISIGNPVYIDNTNNRVGIGDSTPAAQLVVGSDSGAGYATGAGELYVQNDIEADGNIYMANALLATQSWVGTQGFLTGESDPQVDTVSTSGYMCYSDGSAIDCADSGVTFNTGTNTVTAGDFSCTDCLGSGDIGDGLGTGEIDETAMQQRVSGTCAGNTAMTAIAQAGTVTCSSTFLTAEADTLANVTGRGATTSTASSFTTTANPGLTVGDGSTGYLKVGGSTISDAAGDLLLTSDTSQIKLADVLYVDGFDICGVGDVKDACIGSNAGTIDVGLSFSASNIALRTPSTTGIIYFESNSVGGAQYGLIGPTGLTLQPSYGLLVDTNTLKVDASGDTVGIGTTSPNSKLHVIGGVCVETSDSGCTATSGSITATVASSFTSTANPGLTVGGGTTGYLKVGSTTISDQDSGGNYLKIDGGMNITSGDIYLDSGDLYIPGYASLGMSNSFGNGATGSISIGDATIADSGGDLTITSATTQVDVADSLDVSGTLSATDLSCSNCLGSGDIGDGLGTSEIDETVMQQRVSSTCTGNTAIKNISQSGTVGCSDTFLTAESDPQVDSITNGYYCRGDASSYVDCDKVGDGSGDCTAGDVCLGGHTHSSYLTAEVDGSISNELSTLTCTNAATSCSGSGTTAYTITADNSGACASGYFCGGGHTHGSSEITEADPQVDAMTNGYFCRSDASSQVDCDVVGDATTACAANAVCLGGHTHGSSEITEDDPQVATGARTSGC
jgi:hypothetical protein